MQGLLRYWNDQRRLAAEIPDGYDIVNPHGNAIHWAAAAYKRRTGTPVTWLCNDFWPMTHQPMSDGAGLADQLKVRAKQALVFPFDRIDHASVHAMNNIVVLSERVKAQMADHYGVRSTIIRPGVTRPNGEIPPEALRARLGIRTDSFMLLTVCMLMRRRRLEDVVYAVRTLVDQGHDVSYVIAGSHSHSPDYAQEIKTLVQTLGLEERVKLTGEVPENELGSYYHACDAFVWPADENQSWGMACMEAMLSRRPVLVSSANGLSEVLTDGLHALLFAPHQPDSIARRVGELLASDELRTRLMDHGSQLVSSHYSWRSNAQAMLDTFDRAIAARYETRLGPVPQYSAD
jgi:glycosyltransferase involved in cell wall biosynthesis